VRPEYAELIARRLAIPPVEGPDKTATLEEAVRRHVRPGQTLWLGAAHGRPGALVRELVRQWWGRRPGWTVATTGFGSPATDHAQTQSALIVDKILSDDVVRVVFDTCRSVADRSLALNEVRVRLFLARPSSRRSEVVLSRIATFTVILRTNNNATANEAAAGILGGDMTQNLLGVDFPY